MHDFMAANEDLKQIQVRFDEVVSNLAMKLKGELTPLVKQLLKSFPETNPIFNELIEKVDELDEALYEAEVVEQNLQDAINSISGLAMPPEGTERIFEILHYEGKQLNQLIKDLNFLKSLIIGLKDSKEIPDEIREEIKQRLDDLLTDFSRFQDYLHQNIPILQEVMNSVGNGLKDAKRYYENAGI